MPDIPTRQQQEIQEIDPAQDAARHRAEQRLRDAEPAAKGRDFERWAEQHVFGDKQRIRIEPEHNQHLAKIDPEGLGLLTERVSDNYVGEDGSLWDCKAYGEHSAIDRNQLRDYKLMEDAGYVYDTSGKRVEVKSVNYLFSDKAAAEANAWRLQGEATAWYVDDLGRVNLLQ